MKILSRKKLFEALYMVEEDLKNCQIRALPSYVHNLIGAMTALKFALGFSERENMKRQEAALKECPYIVAKIKKLTRRMRTTKRVKI